MASSKTVQEDDVGVSAKTNRILALDLIRGYFLLVIMINHIELYPNGFDFFTGKGRLFVSAAEGFFFMSGLLIGMVYKRRLSLGMRFIFLKIWRRALILYLGSVIFTFIFVAWAVASNHASIKYGLPNPMSWHWVIKETLLMRYAFGWTDFLIRFAILMIFAPFVFWLAAKGKWRLALAGIFVAWLFRGQNFSLAWQVLFNSGILIGFYWQQIFSWFRRLKPKSRSIIKISVASITAISFTYSYLSVYLQALLNHIINHLPHNLQTFTYKWNSFNDWIWQYAQKWTIGPLRLLFFFCWFIVLYWLVSRYQMQINRKTRGIFELLGRNSLFVYIVHAFIVFTIKLFVPIYTDFIQNFLFTAVGIVALTAITLIYQLLRSNPLPASLSDAKRLLSKSKTFFEGNS